MIKREKTSQTETRGACLICNHTVLQDLCCLKDFPVYMACTNRPRNEDFTMNMVWHICSECGTIQLKSLPPLEWVYRENHNEMVGPTWRKHDRELAEFIRKHGKPPFIVIGHPIRFFTESQPDFVFIKCPQRVNFVEESLSLVKTGTVIHSHVMEHWHNPRRELYRIARMLKVGGRMVFSIPLMERLVQQKIISILNFEHTYYLSDNLVDYLLSEAGFTIVDRKHFQDHSIFYACEKRNILVQRELPKSLERNRALFHSAMRYHREQVAQIIINVAAFNGPAYIFGAHVFSQYLFGLGLDERIFEAVLDNGPAKIGRRFYGTGLITRSPEILRDKTQALVVLRTGVYDREIKKDIRMHINKAVIFC